MLHTVRCTSCPRSAHRFSTYSRVRTAPAMRCRPAHDSRGKDLPAPRPRNGCREKEPARGAVQRLADRIGHPLTNRVQPQLSSISTGYHPNARCATNGIRIAGDDWMSAPPQQTQCVAIRGLRARQRTGRLLPGIGRIAAAFAFRVVHARQSGRGHAVAPSAGASACGPVCPAKCRSAFPIISATPASQPSMYPRRFSKYFARASSKRA